MVPVAKKWKKTVAGDKGDYLEGRPADHVPVNDTECQTYLMGPVYREFLDRADNCDMCILALDSGDTYKLIESGELEAGLIANPGYSRTVASIPPVSGTDVFCMRGRQLLRR